MNFSIRLLFCIFLSFSGALSAFSRHDVQRGVDRFVSHLFSPDMLQSIKWVALRTVICIACVQALNQTQTEFFTKNSEKLNNLIRLGTLKWAPRMVFEVMPAQGAHLLEGMRQGNVDAVVNSSVLLIATLISLLPEWTMIKALVNAIQKAAD